MGTPYKNLDYFWSTYFQLGSCRFCGNNKRILQPYLSVTLGAVRLERRRLSPILFPGFLAALLDFFVAVQLKLLLG